MSATLPLTRDGRTDEAHPDEPTPPRRGRVLIVVALVGVLVAAITVWIVAFSPVLGVMSVTVRGTHYLSAEQVKAAAAIANGTPLVRLDAAAVTRRVAALPEVATATVRSDYPSSVTITVTERTPVGFVLSGRAHVLVDKTGDQFRSVPTRPPGLPLFAVPHGVKAKATGRAVATVAAALTPTLLAKVASIQAFDPTAITLLLSDQRVVRWGSAERSTDKARVLLFLLTRPASQIDLTNPDQVVTR
jgi:cell division protein FtsQ